MRLLKSSCEQLTDLKLCRLYANCILPRCCHLYNTVVYNIHEPRKQLLFVTVRGTKLRCRQAEQGHWHGDRRIQRERQTSAYEQGKEDGYKNVKSEGNKGGEGRGEWQTLYPHPAFEWLRVAANEVGTRINQTQPLGLGTHSSHVGIFRFWCLKKFIFISSFEVH